MIFSLLMIPVLHAWGAWVACTLWTWFLVPLGAPVVGLLQMIGMRLALKYLLLGAPRDRTTHADAAAYISDLMLWPVSAGIALLLVGAIVRGVLA